MLLGTNLEIPKGATNLGTSKERSTPNSQALKKSLVFSACAEVLKKEPKNENLKSSAPLKVLRLMIENLPESPSLRKLE